MKYELKWFDDLVTNLLSETFNHTDLSQSDFQQWYESLLKEKQRIQDALIVLAFSQYDEQLIERQIQLYQNKLILLIRAVSEARGVDPNTESGESLMSYGKLSKEILLCLTGLLGFIEKHLSKYFNLDSIISPVYFVQSTNNLLLKLQAISETGRNKRIDPKLLKNISYHMKSFIQSNKGTTYRRCLYCKTFICEIHDLIHSKLVGLSLEKRLIVKIIYLNFNVYSMYSYIANRITRHYQSRTLYNDQLLSLQLFKKLINQAQTKPDFEFNAGVDSLKLSLSKWAEEEITYFKERRQLAIQFQEKSQLQNLPPKSVNKLYSNLSVAQLSYFMKLLVGQNVLIPENTSKLVDFISENFSTGTQKDISRKSIRNKIYSTELTAIENVQELLKELIINAEKDKSLN